MLGDWGNEFWEQNECGGGKEMVFSDVELSPN